MVYFSPVPFGSYAQRPHYLVKHFLSRGIESVLWVEPYPTRLPTLRDLMVRDGSALRGFQGQKDAMELLRIPAIPLEPLPGGAFLNRSIVWRKSFSALASFCSKGKTVLVIGKPSALSLWALSHLRYQTSFFDLMDDFPAFYSGLSRRSMARTMRRVVEHADAVLCSSHALYERISLDRKKQIVLNGYDMSSLPEAPADRNEDIIGYVGTIGRWFDWPLVVQIAESLPESVIRLVGPEFVPRPNPLPPNIEIWPQCAQAEAVEHVRRFSIGLIPFLQNELTECVDPIKYYEYRAMGLPVWSTDFGEMRRRNESEGVWHIRSGKDWITLHGESVTQFMTQSELMRYREANDWSVRFKDVDLNATGPTE